MNTYKLSLTSSDGNVISIENINQADVHELTDAFRTIMFHLTYGESTIDSVVPGRYGEVYTQEEVDNIVKDIIGQYEDKDKEDKEDESYI